MSTTNQNMPTLWRPPKGTWKNLLLLAFGCFFCFVLFFWKGAINFSGMFAEHKKAKERDAVKHTALVSHSNPGVSSAFPETWCSVLEGYTDILVSMCWAQEDCIFRNGLTRSCASRPGESCENGCFPITAESKCFSCGSNAFQWITCRFQKWQKRHDVY